MAFVAIRSARFPSSGHTYPIDGQLAQPDQGLEPLQFVGLKVIRYYVFGGPSPTVSKVDTGVSRVDTPYVRGRGGDRGAGLSPFARRSNQA